MTKEVESHVGPQDIEGTAKEVRQVCRNLAQRRKEISLVEKMQTRDPRRCPMWSCTLQWSNYSKKGQRSYLKVLLFPRVQVALVTTFPWCFTNH